MKQEVKLTVKMLAFVMALLILIVSLPVSAFANAISNEASDTSTDNISTNADIESEGTAKDVAVLEENEALREENIKHFKLSDGTIKAVVYSQAVHYKDADGSWVDIDNALTLNGSEYSAGNKSEIKFANKSGSNGLVSIKDGDYKIDFTPLNTNKVSVAIENPQSNNSRKFEDVSMLNSLVSKAIYSDIYDGIDIEYVLIGNNIKENIIVKEKQDSYSFSFELKLNKLSAELDNGAIILSDYDSGEQVYEIPAPYMFDNNNEYSQSVEYTLTQNSKWKYTFTVTADAAWINDADRAFPVTIDPTIGVNEDYISDYTNGESATATTLTIGDGSIVYVEINTIPSLPKDSFIASASLNLRSITAGNNYIGSYEADTTTIEGYNQITTAEKWYYWDISRSLSNWYNSGASSGKIRLETISGTGESEFYSMESPSVGSATIVITYRDMKGAESYWSYLSQNVGIAGAGSVNLKTGNLMFAIPTLTTTDSLFGFTPTLIYNAAIAGELYTSSTTQTSNPMPCMPYGFKFNTQETIRQKTYLNSQLESEAYYVWADSDGTEHCFFRSKIPEEENIYYDEDGLQYKLTVDTSSSTGSITLVDTDFNVRTFLFMDANAWYLKTITDKNGNALGFNFIIRNRYPILSDICVIPNGLSAIEMLNIGYNSSSGMPCVVYNPSNGKAVLFKYSSTTNGTVGASGSYLREIQHIRCDIGTTLLELRNYASGTDTSLNLTVDATASYEYDSYGNLTKATDGVSGYSVEYTAKTSASCVNKVQEYGENQTQGQVISINYYNGYTEVITSGSDDTPSTSDDLINVYTFDEYGRVVSTYTTNSARTEIYGAVTGEYANVEKAKNNLAVTTVINGNSANYVLNGNFEWDETNARWWTLSDNAVLSSSSYKVDWDNTSLRCSVSANETASAEQITYLAKGTYTVSLDVEGNTTPNLTICFKAVSSTNTYTGKIPVNEVLASGSGGFASFTFEVTEEKETKYDIGIYLEGNEAIEDEEYITIDNIMLAKATGASSYNLVNFGNAQYQGFDNLGPNEWAAHLTEVDAARGRSIYLEGEIGNEYKAHQIIYSAPQSAIDNYINTGAVGTTSEDFIFTVSGFAKGASAIAGENSVFALKLYISSYRDYKTTLHEDYAYATFGVGNSGWQFSSATLCLPATSFIKEITVECEYSNNVGTAYFDDITLTCDKNGDTTRYLYYGDGKLKAELKGTSGGTYYNYNDNGDTTNIISKKSGVTYTYDANHNLMRAQRYSHPLNPVGEYDIDDLIAYCGENLTPKSTSIYTYNSYGLVTMERTYDATSTQYTQANYVYDTSASSKMFGALTTSVDTFGKSTNYFYDSTTCQLISVVESDNTGYYYTYDDLGNLIMVQPATVSTTIQPITNSAQVEYVYNDNNQLESIVANGITYVFTYDEFGNQQSISIGSIQIVSQETNANNGKVTKVTYANGTTVEYVYDHLSRVVETKYTKGTAVTVYSYEYDSNGNLCKYVDGKNGTTTIYKYDVSGKLVKMIEYDTEELKNNFGVSYHYDEESRLEAMYCYEDYLYNSNSYANISNAYYLAYNTDNSLRYVNVGVGNSSNYKISYTYDDFSRYANKVIEFGNIDNTTTYSYLSSSNVTSALVSQYTTNVTNDTDTLSSQTFVYTYDTANQNITEISDAYGNVLYRYTYDNLDRLIREDNSVTNKTTLYTYDKNGNITGETIFLYTLGDAYDSTFIESNLWTYANSQWGDQLTKYNGLNIYYDSMGNPTRYYNGLEFAWENVNNLVGIGNNITYTYNDNGIRTSKTINGITHTYHLDGTRILSETFGSALILYIYDEVGSIIGMAFRTSSYAKDVFDTYLFTKNLQGDIIGIYDTNGNCVASYTYNAWGEHTVTNNTTANIGDLNPFRYRGYYYDTETNFYYLNARYYDPQICRFISPDHVNNLGANGDLNSYNLYAYCSNNPVMYVDPTGEFAWLLVAIVALFVVDTIVETSILLNSEEYSAENVYDEENGTVEVPNSAFFNNPIAQYAYADYLCKNVDNGEYFTGGVSDIIAEWQWHNIVFSIPVAAAMSGDIVTAGGGAVLAYFSHESTINLNLGNNIESENRWYVLIPSLILKNINKKLSFGILE